MKIQVHPKEFDFKEFILNNTLTLVVITFDDAFCFVTEALSVMLQNVGKDSLTIFQELEKSEEYLGEVNSADLLKDPKNTITALLTDVFPGAIAANLIISKTLKEHNKSIEDFKTLKISLRNA